MDKYQPSVINAIGISEPAPISTTIICGGNRDRSTSDARFLVMLWARKHGRAGLACHQQLEARDDRESCAVPILAKIAARTGSEENFKPLRRASSSSASST
jgi:hypothetical protein